MVLEGQEMSIDRLGLNLNELADAALRRIPETRIAGAFEVPAILAGLGAGLDSATYANAEALTEFFTETTLIPRWRSVAGQFQAQLLPDFGAADPGLVVEFDLSEVRALADDEDAKWARWRGAWTDGLATKNEARVALGMDPTQYGDVFLIGGKLVPADRDPAALAGPRAADPGRRRAPHRPGRRRRRAAPDDGTNPGALPEAGRPSAPSTNALDRSERKADDDPAARLATLADAAHREDRRRPWRRPSAEALDNLASVVAGRIASGKDDPDALVEAGDHDELMAVLGDGHLAAYNQAGLDVRGVLGGEVTPLSAADVDLAELMKTLEASTTSAVRSAIAAARARAGGRGRAEGHRLGPAGRAAAREARGVLAGSGEADRRHRGDGRLQPGLARRLRGGRPRHAGPGLGRRRRRGVPRGATASSGRSTTPARARPSTRTAGADFGPPRVRKSGESFEVVTGEHVLAGVA